MVDRDKEIERLGKYIIRRAGAFMTAGRRWQIHIDGKGAKFTVSYTVFMDDADIDGEGRARSPELTQ